MNDLFGLGFLVGVLLIVFDDWLFGGLGNMFGGGSLNDFFGI